MTDKYLQEIEKAVQKAGIDGTLAKEAVARFHAVLEENDELRKANDSQTQQLSNKRDECAELSKRVAALDECCQDWAGREQDLLTREAECTRNELLAEYNQIRVNDHKEMVKLIFRNPVTMSQAVTPGHAGHVDQYGNQAGQEYPTTHDLKKEDE